MGIHRLRLGGSAANRRLNKPADLLNFVNKSDPETSNPIEDAQLIEQETVVLLELARKGDEEAFGKVVKMYHERVSAVIYRVVNNTDDTKELAQLTWIKAWQKLESYKKESKFFTWLYRIAVNTSLDFMRQRARRKQVDFEETGNDDVAAKEDWRDGVTVSPDQEIMHGEIRQRFEQALNILSPEHRAALILREVEGQSYKEIAKAMKCRVGTVMSRIFYARRILQEHMKEWR